jgi:DNA-binding transcriptional MerR regulator
MSPRAAANGSAAATGSLLSIGEVLNRLRDDFPDITVSKIRFLESEGLVEPARTAAGYRKFSHADVERLRYVLGAQQNHYLPLKVIKQHLEAIDRGLEPPEVTGAAPRAPRALVSTDGFPDAESFRSGAGEIKLTRAELLSSSGLSEDQLDQILAFGLVAKPRGGEHFDGEDLVVAKTVAEMAAYGLEARHLRPFRTAADREAGLVEQVVTPMRRRRNPDAGSRADDAVRELAALSVRLHAALVRAALTPDRGR